MFSVFHFEFRRNWPHNEKRLKQFLILYLNLHKTYDTRITFLSLHNKNNLKINSCKLTIEWYEKILWWVYEYSGKNPSIPLELFAFLGTNARKRFVGDLRTLFV